MSKDSAEDVPHIPDISEGAQEQGPSASLQQAAEDVSDTYRRSDSLPAPRGSVVRKQSSGVRGKRRSKSQIETITLGHRKLDSDDDQGQPSPDEDGKGRKSVSRWSSEGSDAGGRGGVAVPSGAGRGCRLPSAEARGSSSIAWSNEGSTKPSASGFSPPAPAAKEGGPLDLLFCPGAPPTMPLEPPWDDPARCDHVASEGFAESASHRQNYLDDILEREFDSALGLGNMGEDAAGDGDDGRGGDTSDGQGEQDSVDEELVREKEFWTALVESRYTTGFFMCLTLYVLFAADLDLLFGDNASRLVVMAVTSVVSLLFFAEIFLNYLGNRRTYLGRAYFWLDVVSLLSLVPETLLIELIAPQDQLISATPGALEGLVMLMTRSAKAVRLNRLSRIVRVAALMPRLQRFVSRVSMAESQRLLDRKLQRIFHVLDDDMDGLVPLAAAEQCLRKLHVIRQERTSTTQQWAQHVGSLTSAASRRHSFDSQKMVRFFRFSGFSKQSSVHSTEGKESNAGVSSTSTTANRLFEQVQGFARGLSSSRWSTHNMGMVDSAGKISFPQFQALVTEEKAVHRNLLYACTRQLQQGNSMQSMTLRNSEKVGVKVALSVLLLLFLLTWFDTQSVDNSGRFGFRALDKFLSLHPQQRDGEQVPWRIQKQVEIWVEGKAEWGNVPRTVLYLDLNKMVYCNDLVPSGASCNLYNSSDVRWKERTSLERVDEQLERADYRHVDLVVMKEPQDPDPDLDDEETNRRTTSVVLLYVREYNEAQAISALIGTVLVICIIMLGITLLTRDLVFMSDKLLRPLVELADEMESISRLRLAGVQVEEKEQDLANNTSEIRLLRKSFENMKKAIKSWGKYVPWPVVQLLLRTDAEANLDVIEKEVTIFFSDIASFTTIVESLPPESSLLLLSRYFHDMSNVIDEYSGIVLEFIGDAIMAVYGAPVKNPEHPTAAVDSAVKMLACLQSMNKWFVEMDLPTVSIRCGLHTGRVLVGNMGFQSRMKYGVVGEDSNIPSRLEELNKTYSTEMLISEATYQRLPKDRFIMRPIDCVYLVSNHDCELVYQVMEKDAEHGQAKQEAATLHTLAMECYRSMNFEQAEVHFQKVNKAMREIVGADDKPSSIMIRRCKSYMEDPPDEDWDGTWDRAA